MRKTYAYNSIIFGVLLGILVYATTESVALTVLTGLGVSVIGFIIIRLIENALYKGAENVTDKIVEKRRLRNQEKAMSNGVYAASGANTTQMPQERPIQFPGQPAAVNTRPAVNYCTRCGAKLGADVKFCKACGKQLEI